MALNREALAAYELMLADLDHLLAGQTRDLTQAWVVAWREIAPEAEAALAELTQAAGGGRINPALWSRSRRALRALQVIADQLDALAAGAGRTITAGASTAVRFAVRRQLALIDAQLPPGVSVAGDRMDERALAAIVRRTTQRITAATARLPDAVQASIRRELVRGVVVGDNPTRVARRMLAGTQERFNGGLTRALTISRTELLDAHRAAAAQVDLAHADVLSEWVWLAALTPRTCAVCVARHGTRHPLEEPGPQGHPSCRCTRVPVTRSWEELGFRGIREPRDRMQDADEWFAGLREQEQRSILGPSRYDAWRAGEYPRERWARLRHNDGWRDSWELGPLMTGAAGRS